MSKKKVNVRKENKKKMNEKKEIQKETLKSKVGIVLRRFGILMLLLNTGMLYTAFIGAYCNDYVMIFRTNTKGEAFAELCLLIITIPIIAVVFFEYLGSTCKRRRDDK